MIEFTDWYRPCVLAFASLRTIEVASVFLGLSDFDAKEENQGTWTKGATNKHPENCP